MIRAVVLANYPGACRIRFDDGTKARAENSLNRRPPLGAVVLVQRVQGRWFIIGRPR